MLSQSHLLTCLFLPSLLSLGEPSIVLCKAASSICASNQISLCLLISLVILLLSYFISFALSTELFPLACKHVLI